MVATGSPTDAAGKKVLTVLNPYTGEVLDTVPAADKADVDAAVAAAVEALRALIHKEGRA